MATKNVKTGSYEPMDKLPSNTLKVGVREWRCASVKNRIYVLAFTLCERSIARRYSEWGGCEQQRGELSKSEPIPNTMIGVNQGWWFPGSVQGRVGQAIHTLFWVAVDWLYNCGGTTTKKRLVWPVLLAHRLTDKSLSGAQYRQTIWFILYAVF